MRRSMLLGLTVGLAVQFVARAASAADLFSDFNAACMKTGGDRAAALAFADAAGWTRTPTEKIPPPAPNFTLKDVTVRTNGDATDKRSLIVGAGETAFAGKAIPADMCLMAGAAGAGVPAEVKAAIGVDPLMTMNMPSVAPGKGGMTMMMYMYRDTPAGRVAVAPTELAGAAATQNFVMIMVMSGDQAKVGMVGRIVLRP